MAIKNAEDFLGPPSAEDFLDAPSAAAFLDDEKPGLLSKIKDAAMFAITELPGAGEGKRIVADKAAELMSASRPEVLRDPQLKDENIMVRAFKEAAVGARNTSIAMPTPESARAAVELTLPASPLDIAGGLLTPGIGKMAGKVGKAVIRDIDALAPAIDDIGKGAGLAAEATGEVLHPSVIRSQRAGFQLQEQFAKSEAKAAAAIQEELGWNEAMRASKKTRDDAYKAVLEKQKILSDYKASLGDAPELADPRFQRTTAKLEGEVKRARGLVDQAKAQMDQLRAARDRQAIPALEPEEIALPKQTTAAPMPRSIPVPEPKVEHVAEASKYINLERLADEGAREVIASLSNDPNFVERITRQKRGVIPLEKSKAAGAALDATKEEFAALKPGRLLKKGTLDAQTAAASAMQNLAGHDLYEVAKLRAQGQTLESLAGRAAMNVEAIVGAQGVISETGRALGAVRLTPLERAQVKMAKVAFREGLLENPGKLDEFLKEIAQLPSDAIAQRILAAKRFIGSEQASALDMAMEARSAALLYNPITWIRNFTGNSMAAMSNLVEAPLSGTVDFLMAKMTGTPQERTIGEGIANAFGMWNGAHQAARDAIDVLKNEASIKGFGADSAFRSRAIPGRTGKVVRIPFRILTASDAFQKGLIGSAELNRLAYRTAANEGLTGVARAQRIESLIQNPTEEMWQGAIGAAEEFSFQGKLPKFFDKLNQAINQRDAPGVFAKIFVPFLKTPVNIARFAMERTLLVSELTRNGVFRKAFLETGATRGEVSDAIARNLVGVAAITSASLAQYSMEGRITGAPPKDRAERDALFGTGWRPWSIKVGGLYVPYRGFEPMASYLGAVAEYSRILREKPDADMSAKATQIMGQTVKNYLSQPFLKNIGDVIDALDDPVGGKSKALLRSVAGSVVPTGLAGIARATDTTLRDPETIVEQMLANTPYFSQRIRKKLDRYGRPITRTTYMLGLVDKPLPANDPIENELVRLEIPRAVGFPDNQLSQRQLNKDEFNELLTRAGGNIRELLSGTVTDPEYANLPKDKQVSWVKNIVSKERKKAAAIVRPKVEMRALGFTEKLKDEELEGLNRQIEMPDFAYKNDGDRRKVVREYLQDLREYR